MSSSLLCRRVCCLRRLPGVHIARQQAWVSTTSAINRGLRATKSDGRNFKGGKDWPSRARASARDAQEERIPRPPPEDRRRLSAYTGHQTATRNGYAGRIGTPREIRPAFSGSRHRDDRRTYQPLNPGRRERAEQAAVRSSRSDGKSTRFSVIEASRSRAESALGLRGQPNFRAQPKPAEGLLRSIKDACRQIHFLQQQQEAGESHSVDELVRDARSSLKKVNSYITSGQFQHDEPAEAVVSLFRKKARAGTFLAGQMPDGERSVIYVTKDGVIDLAVGKTAPVNSKPRDARPTRDARESEVHRHDRRDARSNDRSVDARRPVKEDDEVPVLIPYTTAASEFLYGYNSVLAALTAQRRKLYKLYMHPKIFNADIGGEGTVSGDKPGSELVALAKEAGIPFRNEFKTAMLDKMSDGRPHNGVILEASKLPAVPVVGLRKPESSKGLIPIELGPQTAEDAKINGSPKVINALSCSWRHPFIVMVDGITDPGNLGNIIRTCHFYGVDAIAVATNTCANLSSAVLAKASAGACEAMRLLSVSQPSNFVHDSSKYRWKVYAAVAPTGKTDFSGQFLSTSRVSADSPLAKHPCILMLGAEGEGLRQNLRNRADYFVSIEGGQRAKSVPDIAVDSMNVGVATGVLLEAFMRKPVNAPDNIANDDDFLYSAASSS
ncbi:hypothetical protein BST61_g7570 [Cercospora zeina]